MTVKPGTPITIAVVVSLICCAFLLSLAAAIGGSYVLILQAEHKQQAFATQVVQQQTADQIRQAVPECEQLQAMDNASNGAVNSSSSPDSYGRRLAAAIHSFNVASKCPLLLSDMSKHMSDAQIVKSLGE